MHLYLFRHWVWIKLFKEASLPYSPQPVLKLWIMYSSVEHFKEFKVSFHLFFFTSSTSGSNHKMEFVQFVSETCALVGCQHCQIHLMPCYKKDINVHIPNSRLAMADVKRNCSKIYRARKNEIKKVVVQELARMECTTFAVKWYTRWRWNVPNLCCYSLELSLFKVPNLCINVLFQRESEKGGNDVTALIIFKRI